MAATFLYFAYGSNLLRERILINNPTASFRTIARLDNYRLAFDGNRPESVWKGAAATILQRPGEHVWGCVWEINMDDLAKLDRQEGVRFGAYKPINITVQTPDGQQLDCRSYQMTFSGYPDPRPSPQYMSVIMRGAKQNGLPMEYRNMLASIEDNGYSGELEIMNRIDEIIETFKDKQ